MHDLKLSRALRANLTGPLLESLSTSGYIPVLKKTYDREK